jgi:hypothetical protein
MEGSVMYKIDERTQKMLNALATAKVSLDTQMKIAFQVLLNTLNIPGDAKIIVGEDFSTLTVEEIPKPEGPTAPVSELSTGPLSKFDRSRTF